MTEQPAHPVLVPSFILRVGEQPFWVASATVSKLTNQWIEIFRAGDYGEQGSFSESDLDRVVANYRPDGGHEAPIVIGHPKENVPAFGWVEGLKRSGGVLLAKMKDVQPQFEQMVEQRLFPKRSASFYRTPDGKSIQALRHVGFLGAMPPVVKGLADCKFADQSEQEVFEFQENDMVDVNEQSIVDKVVARFAEMFGGKKAGEAASFSEADAARIATDAVAEAIKPIQAELTETKTKLAATEAKFSERETKISTTETEQRATAAVDKLKAKGRWIPAFEKGGLALVFSELAKVTDTVEFGEGDKKKKQTPLEILADFMESLPKIVPGGAVYGGESSRAVSMPRGVNPGRLGVDEGSVRLDAAAKDFAEKNNVSYSVAIDKVLEKNPELGVAGGATSGQV